MVWALPLFWAACIAAGYFYTQNKGVPWEVARLVAPAFLLEATLFLALGIERWRLKLEKLPAGAVAGLLTVAAVAPYCAAALPTHTFHWGSFLSLALMAAVISLWYIALPHNPGTDLGLLAVLAAVMLSKVFGMLYLRPHPSLALEALGQAMLIRTGLFAMLSIRRVKGVGFGFWPSGPEWRIGVVHFLIFLPLAAGLAWWIGFAAPQAPRTIWWETLSLLLLTFFGVLWVLALGEEFFFRGLLQQWITSWLRNEWAGLILTALLFGSAHFWYRQFPNWRFAALAALAGLFYGLAFRRAKSIRASMVTHALTVTAWRVFFS
jgi:uncharacterized protein